jgi:hypothetical protein
MFLFLGLLILVFAGLCLLFYFLPRKLGYPTAGKYLTIVFVLSISGLAILYIFEDKLFTASQASNLVKEHGIMLNDNFQLKSNESTFAIGEYYHTFKLEISEKDRATAIAKIKGADGFEKANELRSNLPDISGTKSSGRKLILNYETKNAFVNEYVLPSGREGYAPTFRRISIDKVKNELTFEEIDD